MRSSMLIATLATVLVMTFSSPAGAQPGPGYAATPPTKGALYADGPDDRYLLGGSWLYRADPFDAGVSQGWWRDVASTAGWTPVSVPNSFNAGDFSSASMTGSVGWYRRDFTLPARAFPPSVPARFRSWIVRFESVNYHATVWLNGRQIGTHAGAYLPFEFSLKGLHGGVNRLIVRVDDRRKPGDLPPGPSGGWWNFGGINQEVYLRSVARADMSQVMVRPILPCPTCTATIQEQVSVTNTTRAPQTVSLKGTYGGAAVRFGGRTIAPGATWVARSSVKIRFPHLWAPDSPYLYKATLTLGDGHGRALQRYFTYSGIRSIQVVAGHLELNGRPLNLRGVALHEVNITTGAALNPTQLASLFGWAHELGATIIRGHYPLNPQIEQLADQQGIVLWSEVPVYQVAQQFYTQGAWVRRAQAILRQNIAVNQNHPSVLLWSIANELTTPPRSGEASYIAGASALAHRLDPTRPVGMAIADWPGVPCQSAYAPLDVIGFNDYFGWFDAGGGTTDDRDALGPFLDSLHACYPTKALMVTEFGFDGNRHGPVEERGTYDFQANAAAFHLGVFASKPYLSGAIWFAMQNFPARPGATGGNPIGDPPWVEKGEIDQFGNPTPLFPLIQSIYKSTVQIAPVATAQRAHHKSAKPSAKRAGNRQSRQRRNPSPEL